MTFLLSKYILRDILQFDNTIEDSMNRITKAHRTCEYARLKFLFRKKKKFYLISFLVLSSVLVMVKRINLDQFNIHIQ
jgi:hypothetical protein